MVTSTMSRLDTLRHAVADAEAYARELELTQAAHARHLARLRMEYRQGLQEAQRLLPQFRQASQAAELALYKGHAQVQADAARLRQQLTALVGTETVDRLTAEPAFVPWWVRPDGA